MKILIAFAVLVSTAAAAQTPCTANVEGFTFRNVYITGNSYKAVEWAYKNLSEQSCLSPVTSVDKADVILELRRPDSGQPESPVFAVSCTGGDGFSQCTDTDGNELDVTCDRAGNCVSYFGPSIGASLGSALKEAFISSAAYAAQARIYTRDHRLIWDGRLVKGSLWEEKMSKPPLAPPCKTPGAWSGSQYHYHFRQWAEKHCGIVFPPPVSIDLKANARIAEKNAKEQEIEEMKRNAKEAAKRQ